MKGFEVFSIIPCKSMNLHQFSLLERTILQYGRIYLWGRNFCSIIQPPCWRLKLTILQRKSRKIQQPRHGNRTRARSERSLLTLLDKGRRPHALARAGRARARARARALSPPRKRECSNFNKDNPQFDQGKSCSVSRVWQLCQI